MPAWLTLLNLALTVFSAGLLLGLLLGLNAPRRRMSQWYLRGGIVGLTWLLAAASLTASIVSALLMQEHRRRVAAQ